MVKLNDRNATIVTMNLPNAILNAHLSLENEKMNIYTKITTIPWLRKPEVYINLTFCQ